VILLLDNYDSFTWNLYQYLGELGAEPRVLRNDALTADAALALHPARIVISPGPGTPAHAGISVELVRKAAAAGVPLLGVCLGHQAIGEAFGGRIVRAARAMHGKTSPIHHDGRTLFAGQPNPLTATRYHSLIVEKETLPAALEVSAWSGEGGEIMGLRHRTLPVEGVQFHPESLMTQGGLDLLRAFLAGSR
jgi:anthranilate synthase component 2